MLTEGGGSLVGESPRMLDVVIAGAGPTGLGLACELARADLSFRIVDAKSGTSTIMKATAVTPTTLEFFEDLGVLERCLALGTRVRALVLYSEGKKIVERGWDSVDSPHPFMMLLGQQHTERILHERLQELGSGVAWNTSLTSFEEDDAGVTVRLGEEAVRARYLVGCDGSKSTVAAGLGVEYRDLDFPTDYVVAELEIETDAPRDDWSVFFAETGAMGLGAMPHGRWGIMASLPPLPDKSSRVGTEPTLAELQALWDERSPFPGRLSNPQWMSHYRTHARVARHHRQRRIFLAGDAAHQVSPLSSLGMNSGLLDARNLGWKLALASRGMASQTLLDSYDQEHRSQVSTALVLSAANELVYPWTNLVLRTYRDVSYRLMLNFEPFWRAYVTVQSQKDRNLRRSPAVRQHVGLPLPGTPRLSDHGSCVAAWMAFGEGPHAGDPARDVALPEGRLFSRMFGGLQTLLIFGGCDDPSPEMRQHYREFAQGLADLPAGFLRTVFVQRGERMPEGLWEGEILLDPEGAAHARYGAEGECLYLVRPDGYVGFRSQPPLWEPLARYLEEVFGFSLSGRAQAAPPGAGERRLESPG